MALLLNIWGLNSGMIAFAALSIGLSYYLIRNAWYRKWKVLNYDVKPCQPVNGGSKNGNQSLIIFYNQGLQLIRYDDFANEGPLQVNSSKKLMNAELLGTSDEFAQIAFNETSAGFSVTPEYMDNGDAFVLRVDHEQDAELKVEGRMIGGRICRGKNLSFWYKLNFSIHVFTRLLILVGYIFLCSWLTAYLQMDIRLHGTYEWIILPLYFTVAILAIYLIATFDYDIRKVHRLVREHYQ